MVRYIRQGLYGEGLNNFIPICQERLGFCPPPVLTFAKKLGIDRLGRALWKQTTKTGGGQV
jgi:hypothetical protein